MLSILHVSPSRKLQGRLAGKQKSGCWLVVRPGVWELVNQRLGIWKLDPREMEHLGDRHWWDLGRAFFPWLSWETGLGDSCCPCFKWVPVKVPSSCLCYPACRQLCPYRPCVCPWGVSAQPHSWWGLEKGTGAAPLSQLRRGWATCILHSTGFVYK